jgi:uncharacterized protein YbjT (DUF2867 family)
MKVAIAGATGLTGSLSLQLLLQSPSITEVISIGRRKTGIQHSKLSEVPLEDGLLKQPVKADAFICCLGTTIKKAGSKEAFKAIDYDLPVHLASKLNEEGCRTAAIVSAIGANAKSSVFYLRTKGETEEALKKTGFDSLSFLRPSFIAGPREERRGGERFMIGFMRLVSPLMFGGLAKYRAASANSIAEKLVQCILAKKPGTEIYYFTK